MNQKNRKFYAHSREGDPNPENWQELEVHLRNVAKLASEFASVFSSSEWGYLAGLWHDLGKYSIEFQEMLTKSSTDKTFEGQLPIHVNHSTAGGIMAVDKFNNAGRILAYLITGHHAGLPD